MKTNRPFIFLAICLFACLGVTAAAWSVETKSSVQSKQITAPAAGAPVMTQAIKDVPPQVIIVTPVEGDTWYASETRDIQWKTIAIPEGFKIKIRFVRSDKSEYLIADNLPRSGKFSWKIDGGAFQSKQGPTGFYGSLSVPVDTTGKLTLTASDGATKYEGEVSLSLVIPKVKITSPKNGDTWHVGKTYLVAWQTTGPALSPVQINIVAGGGFSVNFLYSTNMSNTGHTYITVPASPILDNTTDFHLVILSSIASFPYNDEVAIKVMK